MKLYGLTGGPGMGKSAAAETLADEGIPVVDTDSIARDIVAPGQIGLGKVAELFGPGILTSTGGLNRRALAEIVFKDAGARRRLESMLHPLIREAWQAKANEWKADGRPVGVVVIPLLFETAAEQFFQSVICIACSATLQSARLHKRGWDAEQVAGRLSAQLPIEKKIERSDFVIWNESSLQVLREQLGRIPPLKGSAESAAKKNYRLGTTNDIL